MRLMSISWKRTGSRRRVAAPEDVAVVEIPVLDPLFVELHGEAGEGF